MNILMNGSVVKQELNVKALYRHCVRKNGRPSRDRHIRLKQWISNSIRPKMPRCPSSGSMFVYYLYVVRLNKPKPRQEGMTGRSSCAPIPRYPLLRFCMLAIAKNIQNGANVAQMRLQFCDNSIEINFSVNYGGRFAQSSAVR